MTKTVCRSVTAAILVVFALSGCGGGGGGGGGTGSGTAPVIQSLYLTGAPASPGGTITATVNAQSAQGLALTYSWSVSNGWTISSGGTTSVATLIAPHSYTATGTATVTITDSQNRSVFGGIVLSMVSDSAPVIQSLFLTGAPASPGGTITATVDAQSAQGLALTYSWSVSSGWSISSGGTTSVVTITAPDSYATAGTATVTVTDSQNRSVAGDIALSTVSDTAPVISGITISPQPVVSAANLVATASDVNGDTLAYSWTVGGISSILTGSSVTWNSPGIPGYYTVGVAVSDGTTTVNGSVSKMSIGSASPWPRFGRDIQGTRLSPIDTSANTGLVTKWTYTTGAAINFSSPAIGADGTVYVGSNDGKLYAVLNSNLTWSFPTSGGVLSSPAIAADGTVYVGSSDFSLYAIKPDGTAKWITPVQTGGPVYSSPAIGADGTVYVGSGDKKLYAINPDRTLKWSYTTGGAINNSSPALGADGTVYIGSGDGYLYAINPNNGSLKWRFSIGGISYSSPAIGADGTVYIGSTSAGGNIYAINPDGSQKWSYATGGFVYSSPAIGADGTVFVGSFNKNIYAISSTGALKWSYTTGSLVESSPAIGADGTVYVGSSDNNLYAIDSTNGTLKWSYATVGAVTSSPAIGADGTVYIGSGDKALYAVQ